MFVIDSDEADKASEKRKDGIRKDLRNSTPAPHHRERLWIVAYPNSQRCKKQSDAIASGERHADSKAGGNNVSDTRSIRQAEWGIARPPETSENARGWADNRGRKTLDECWQWWKAEPSVGRVVDGVPNRVDRLRCLGNSIVPQIAEMIFNQTTFDSWRYKERAEK